MQKCWARVAPGMEESLTGLVQAGIALERQRMAFQAWCPTVQQLSLPSGLPKMGYRCAGVQELEPLGVCMGLRGAWLDLEGGHPITSSIHSSAPSKRRDQQDENTG